MSVELRPFCGCPGRPIRLRLWVVLGVNLVMVAQETDDLGRLPVAQAIVAQGMW